MSVMSLSSNSEPVGRPDVTGSAEVILVVTTPAAHSSSIVYILCRVAVPQQKGMGYPLMRGVVPSDMCHTLQFLHDLVVDLCKISRFGLAYGGIQ